MDAATLNRKLAKALGWIGPSGDRDGKYYVDATGKNSTPRFKSGFSPATSSDHLRLYVLPEVEKRKLTDEFCKVMNDEYDVMCLDHYDAMWDAFTAKPGDLAAAALKVLEAGE